MSSIINKIYDQIMTILNKNGINDGVKTPNGLIIPVEAENGFPGYKLAISITEENNNLSIYTSFYHNAVLKDEQKKLLVLLNKFNLESELKFTLYKDFIKVSIDLGEVLYSDCDFIVRNITMFPTILASFEQDLLKVIK